MSDRTPPSAASEIARVMRATLAAAGQFHEGLRAVLTTATIAADDEQLTRELQVGLRAIESAGIMMIAAVEAAVARAAARRVRDEEPQP